MGFPAILANIILPSDKIMKCVFFLPRAHRELAPVCISFSLAQELFWARLKGKRERKGFFRTKKAEESKSSSSDSSVPSLSSCESSDSLSDRQEKATLPISAAAAPQILSPKPAPLPMPGASLPSLPARPALPVCMERHVMMEMPCAPPPPADSLSDSSYSGDSDDEVKTPYLVNYGLTDGVEWPQPKPEGELLSLPSDFAALLDKGGASLPRTLVHMHKTGRKVPETVLIAAKHALHEVSDDESCVSQCSVQNNCPPTDLDSSSGILTPTLLETQVETPPVETASGAVADHVDEEGNFLPSQTMPINQEEAP